MLKCADKVEPLSEKLATTGTSTRAQSRVRTRVYAYQSQNSCNFGKPVTTNCTRLEDRLLSSRQRSPRYSKQVDARFLAASSGFVCRTSWSCFLLVLAIMGWGVMVAPFDWQVGSLPRDPVPVDAIPDIGENQQIVFTEWMGRSPQDVEDQIGYPMTVALLGIPEVKTIRSYSMFGFSTIYVIFNEKAEFYWSRSRVLEKLNSLPAGTLPEGVQPTLGTGRHGTWTDSLVHARRPRPGRRIQRAAGIYMNCVRFRIGTFATRSHLPKVSAKSRRSADSSRNIRSTWIRMPCGPPRFRWPMCFSRCACPTLMSGARTIELNKAEYVIRGLGFIEQVEDIEKTVVRVADNVPITIKDVANVRLGPALRRGAMDKAGCGSGRRRDGGSLRIQSAGSD